MNISYEELIDAGFYSARLELRQHTEKVTSQDGQRIVNSDYGNTYYQLELNFRYYPYETDRTPIIETLFSLGMADSYELPIGKIPKITVTHSDIRGLSESILIKVPLPGATEITAEFLSTILELTQLQYGVDILCYGEDTLGFGTSPGIEQHIPEIDHSGRLFNSKGKIYAIVEDKDTIGSPDRLFIISPPFRKSGVFSTQFGTVGLGESLSFRGRISKSTGLTQDVDGWNQVKLTLVEDPEAL